MDLFNNLLLGFEAVLTVERLTTCFVGVAIGMVVGVLPGIGALTAISLALPITFYLEPTSALIMLAGIFYGAQYGGSIASILLNMPGTPSNAVTCLDGYPMARQGRAGAALFIATVTSFLGGSFAIIVLMTATPLLASLAVRFSSVEYFAIMLLGLAAASTLSIGSPLKGITMVLVGIVLGLVGVDVNSGQPRFTFGSSELMDGVGLIPVAMGLFGLAEILNNMGQGNGHVFDSGRITFHSMIPTREDLRAMWMPTVRGSVLGSVVGAVPGTGPAIASFMSYAVEKKVAKDPSRLGTGAVEGVAAPEASNNAAVQAAFIPTLSLGIPGDVVMAVLLGAMMIHGITPGPFFIQEQPAMFWGLVASFWIGNVLLVLLNIPLIGLWVRVLAIPYRILFPVMLFLICIGVFSIRNSIFDIYLTMLFGVIGYFMLRYSYPAAPLLLGFILGPLMEEHLKRALLISDGSFAIFVERPISAVMLGMVAAMLASSLLSPLRKRMRQRQAL